MTRKQPAIPPGMVGSSSATFARLAIWMAVLFLGKQACQYPLNLHPMGWSDVRRKERTTRRH